jgi:hypothetical protein
VGSGSGMLVTAPNRSMIPSSSLDAAVLSDKRWTVALPLSGLTALPRATTLMT